MALANEPAFLRVERSVLGRPWRDRLDPKGRALARAMVQQHGLPDALARVLAGRGVGCEECVDFLDPKLRSLMPDPSTLLDMDEAVARLVHAVQRGETVAIFGDYDVDGACSSALLSDFLNACGVENIIHIPDRIFEGYGPNIEAIRMLAGQGATLLITVDCGTTSHAALAEARALGMDAIVLDHHQAPVDLPDAIVVNPNRQDDLSGQGALCAAGVVFLTLAALSRALRQRDWWTPSRPAPELLASLDLVALATVADVAPLTGLNRAFVVKGLQVMHGRARVGLSALIDSARLEGPIRASHLGFALGPRINAGGRIGDASLGARLLTLADGAEAARLAQELDRLNTERRAIEQHTLETAIAQAEAEMMKTNRLSCLVVAGEDWHPGVVGLIASRLKERFNVPSFAIAFNGEKGMSSGRTLALLVLPALNEVIDLHTTHLSASRRHLPVAILVGLLVTVGLTLGLAAFGHGQVGRRFAALDLLYGIVLAAALWMTIDLDYPRYGLIRATIEPLVETLGAMKN